jgi:ABC exporter DevB family membrane fusion protein
MKRTIILSAVALVFIAASLIYFRWTPQNAVETKASAQDSETKKQNQNLIAAPGVVEAVSEEIEVGAEMPGKLKSVLVEEGERVVKNQTIAILENADFEALVWQAKTNIEILRRQQETARARLDEVEADKLRLVNGARPQERREVFAGYEQTVAVVEQAKREVARRAKLYQAGDIAREEFERAKRELAISEARSRETRERFDTINAPARADELEKADAAIKLADAQIREFDARIREAESRVRVAESSLAKTIVRAPVNGIVLRKRLKDGESVSPENSNAGIVTIGDTSALRVRVEIDETDVAKIRENQQSFVTADAFGERRFYGRVIKIGQILGRKTIRTERPQERVDTKILEVLVELAPDQKLPLGLRVDAFIGGE